MTVYTTQQYAIQSPELAAQIYYLDMVDKLEDQFSEQFQLSNQPEMAEKQAKALLSSPEWIQHETALKQAYEGISQAWQHGIMKVPAILFSSNSAPQDNQVMYGITDLQRAIEIYYE
ncbi:TIGR03757 family integrating conjugative element protein [Testudinibacter sp. P80/BLE/0925]|uniref:TIGR03757 family integrating conjugative element protein n=1 Tax=Testudinibacter sp. TW-1 TaxID=3417757 RepID=UPI003D35C436